MKTQGRKWRYSLRRAERGLPVVVAWEIVGYRKRMK